MSDVCVLAYSGGLDTSVAISWLKDKFGYDVIALAIDVGQGIAAAELQERGAACGASKTIVIDAREEFARDYVLPSLRANALYQGRYPLVSALSRPLIVKHLVQVARSHGATAVAHGCTGKGNDQVRFEVSTAALAPGLRSLAPVRDAGLSREAAIAYAEEKGIPIPVTRTSPFSIDENLWGKAIEAGVLEDPWVAPPAEAYTLTRHVADAPEEPELVTIAFERGAPVALDGTAGPLHELIPLLAQRAGTHGVGRLDMIEDRLVGIKSREVYEVPAAAVLVPAHRDLEDLTLERSIGAFKRSIEQTYAELVYNGLWFSPLRAALDAFIGESQKPVSGEVRMRLHKGVATPEGRRSPHALYRHDLATYDAADRFDHQAAAGFVKLWGLPLEVWSEIQGPEEH